RAGRYDAVEPTAGSVGRPHGRGYRDGEGHHQGEDGELEVHWKGPQQYRRDVLNRWQQVVAEVAVQDIPQPVEVTLDDRLVETELVADAGVLLGAGIRSEHVHLGTARDERDQEERAEADEEQDGDDEQHPAEERAPDHACVPTG